MREPHERSKGLWFGWPGPLEIDSEEIRAGLATRFAELGIVPSSGGTYRLVRAVGPARAKELLLLRRRVDAGEAHRLGVVTEVVAAGEALPRALELAQQVGELPPLAAAAAKQAANAMAESSREAGIMLERLAYAALAQTDESRAAGEAFSSRKKG